MADSSLRYRVPARLIHWTMAILVLGMIPVGFLMIREGLDRSFQNFLFISHKNIGVLLLLLIFVRVIYRWFRPPVLDPVPMPKLQQFAAHATHFALYALLLILPIAGYVRVRAGGFPIEVLDKMGIPGLVPRSEALAAFAKTVHFYGGYAIAVVAALHIAAAVYHGVVRRDGIFSRMWPPFGPTS